MKQQMLLILTLVFITNSFAQKVSLKKDTILAGTTRYALFNKSQSKPPKYVIKAFSGTELIEAHNARIEVKGKPAYVVTFLNDHKQGMVIKDAGFPLSLIQEIIKYMLVTNGASIDSASELQFVKAHPLPDGYMDVDQMIEY